MELLVVMAVIAVMAGMLLAAVTLVRASARSTVCLSNLRQMGMGFSAYAEDWSGEVVPALLPNPTNPNLASGQIWWPLQISPYLDKDHAANQVNKAYFNGIIFCPSYAAGKGSTGWDVGYGMNHQLDLDSGANRTSNINSWNQANAYIWQQSTVRNPSRRILVGDSRPTSTYWNISLRLEPRRFPSVYVWPNYAANAAGSAPDDWGFCHPTRHLKRANYLMVDGHVQSLTPGDSLLGVADPGMASF